MPVRLDEEDDPGTVLEPLLLDCPVRPEDEAEDVDLLALLPLGCPEWLEDEVEDDDLLALLPLGCPEWLEAEAEELELLLVELEPGRNGYGASDGREGTAPPGAGLIHSYPDGSMTTTVDDVLMVVGVGSVQYLESLTRLAYRS